MRFTLASIPLEPPQQWPRSESCASDLLDAEDSAQKEHLFPERVSPASGVMDKNALVARIDNIGVFGVIL